MGHMTTFDWIVIAIFIGGWGAFETVRGTGSIGGKVHTGVPMLVGAAVMFAVARFTITNAVSDLFYGLVAGFAARFMLLGRR